MQYNRSACDSCICSAFGRRCLSLQSLVHGVRRLIPLVGGRALICHLPPLTCFGPRSKWRPLASILSFLLLHPFFFHSSSPTLQPQACCIDSTICFDSPSQALPPGTMSDRISSPFSSGLSQLDRSPQGDRTSSWLDSQSRHPSSDLPQESSASPSPVALTQRPHLPSNSRSFLRPFQGAPSYTTTPFTATSPVTMPSSSSSQPSSYPAPHRSPASRHLSWNQRRRLGARAPDSPSQVEEIDLTRGLPPSPASGLPLSGSSGSRASGHLYGEITPSSSGSRLNPEAPAYLPLRPPAPPADLPAEAGPSTRAPSMRRISSRANPIEVLDDSDEDDVVFLRSRQTQPQPQRFPEVSHSIRGVY